VYIYCSTYTYIVKHRNTNAVPKIEKCVIIKKKQSFGFRKFNSPVKIVQFKTVTHFRMSYTLRKLVE